MEHVSFFQPKSIDEAKVLLSIYENSKLLAGGTDLLIEIRKDEVETNTLIDLSRLSTLKEIKENEDEVRIGSMVSFTDLLNSDLIKNEFNTIYDCAKSMGSPQIRNMATIGGNVANAAAAADIVPCFISLNAELVIESVDSIRQISCEDYFQDYKSNQLKSNEILTQVIIPRQNERKSGYYKLGKRNSLAIARLSASVSYQLENELISDLTICLGAVGRYPFRVKNLEQQGLGQSVDWLFSEKTLTVLEHEVAESIKGRASMPFKKEAIKGVYKLAVKSALNESGELND